MIAVDDYASFLATEYLHGYVDDGGAAVKFVVPASDDDAARLSRTLRERAQRAGFAVAGVDAVTTKVHAIEQVFFAISRQIEWDALAYSTARRALEVAAYPVADGEDVAVEAVAAIHGVDPRELKRDLDRQLQALVYRDFAMVQEFRIAMLRLCQAQLRTGQVTDAEHAAILDWLTGDLRQISVLKTALIFRRIARHNARHLLFSLAHWLAANGRAGLLLELDIRRLAQARRPSAEERSGHYYTKAAVLDAYEVLRQLVDNTDELSHCCVIAVAAPDFLTDPIRGVDAYQALKLRIFDEVRDRRRDNPYSSLIRLGAA
ncbi:MAG TPA: BREX system ATP-binding domain-containing protein [Acidimicrobiales bacterium]|nr:BREX system ATP-binding domain-containing protein [Acidimicrobiales bacterium]